MLARLHGTERKVAQECDDCGTAVVAKKCLLLVHQNGLNIWYLAFLDLHCAFVVDKCHSELKENSVVVA